MGCSKATLRALVGAEVFLIGVGALALSGIGLLLSTQVMRWFIAL
jgi:hypothetical protein